MRKRNFVIFVLESLRVPPQLIVSRGLRLRGHKHKIKFKDLNLKKIRIILFLMRIITKNLIQDTYSSQGSPQLKSPRYIRCDQSSDHRNNLSDQRINSSDQRKNSSDLRNNSSDHRNNSSDHRNNSSDQRNNSSDQRNNSSDRRKSSRIQRLGSVNNSFETNSPRTPRKKFTT